MSVLVDASVIGSAILQDERDHLACKAYLDSLLTSRRRRVLASHTLIEAYVALTKRNRTPPRIASALIDQLATRFDSVVAATSRESLVLVRHMGRDGVVGPQSYDALIASAARKSGVREIATLNVSHLWVSGPPITSLIRER